MTYEVKESIIYRDHWHVETIGPDGEVYVAVFSGPNAAWLAREYADWQNNK